MCQTFLISLKTSISKPAQLAGLAALMFFLTLSNAGRIDGQWRRLPVSLSYAEEDFCCIYFRPDKPQIGFISFGYNYRTTDGGYTWDSLDLIAGVNDFAFTDSDTGWASAGGLYMTTDGGGTWELINCPDGANDIYYDRKYHKLFLAGDIHGVYSSTDDGATWKVSLDARRSIFDDGNMGQAFSFWNDDTGVAETYYGFYLTTDGGTTWRQVSDVGDHIDQVVAVPGTTTGFAIDIFGVVRRTDDLWQTWQDVYQFPKEFDPFLNTMVGTIANIVGDAQNLFVWRNSACFRSTDQGVTWQSLCGVKTDAGFDSYYCKYYADDHRVFAPALDYYAGQHFWMLNLDSMQYFPTGLMFSDSSKHTTVHPGTPVTVNYSPETSDPIGVDTGHLVFRYDSDALSLTGITLPPSWRILDSSSGGGELNLAITADSTVPIPNPMVSLTFATYLTTPQPPPTPLRSAGGGAMIYLDTAYLSGHRLNCDCAALSTGAPDSVEIDFTGCGNPTIVAAMEGEPPFSIASIVPNPAATGIRVSGMGYRVSGLELQLFDDLGNCVLTEQPSLPYTLNPTPYTLPIDVSALPSGIYFLRLSSDGYAVSRSIAISR